MSSEFLPLWAPDARAFKRATYMASTDDVELLGTVRSEMEEDGLEGEGKVLRHPAGRSTTPFGKHSVESLDGDSVSDQPALERDSGETLQQQDDEPSAEPATDTAPVNPGPGVEIDEALEALEVEVETALNPEALEAIEQEAFKRGRAVAMAEMAEKMQSLKSENASLQKVADSIAPLADELEGLRARMIQQASEDVADMALHMARRVVGETLAVHPQALRKLIVDAIERLPGDDEITVRVRPQDLQSIQDNLPVRRDIRIVEDDSLEGGCVVQAQCGEVSASIETAFTGLRAAVDEWLEDQK